jgi:hypothetical protein
MPIWLKIRILSGHTYCLFCSMALFLVALILSPRICLNESEITGNKEIL